jgi:hypothetical protein
MYSLACKAFSASECDYVAQEATAEKTVQAMLTHARQQHPNILKEKCKQYNEGEILELLLSKMDNI